MAHGSQETARVDLALNEVVLGPDLQGSCGQRLAARYREHHQRHLRRGCANPPYRFQSLRVWQPQGKQNDVDRMSRKMLLSLAHRHTVFELCVWQALFVHLEK